jgi:hypothetical protein
LLASCGRPPDPCADLGAHQALVGTLLFGGDVTVAQWADFVRNIVTPRFPDGLTVWEGAGQWRDPATGRVGAESSRVLLIAAAPSPATGRGFSEIADAYKAMFHQKSVGILVAPSCAAF